MLTPTNPYAYVLDAAIKVAADLHAGVLDKSGQPYILHVLSGLYTETLTQYAEDDEDVVAARAAFVLHDTIEDVEGINETMLYAHLMYNYVGLQAQGSKLAPDLDKEVDALLHRIVGIVNTVSKRDDEKGFEGYLQFIQRIKDNGDPAAEWVKRADIDSNTDPARLALLKPSERDYLERKYGAALSLLDHD